MTSVLLKCRIEAFLFLSKWNKCIIIQNVRFLEWRIDICKEGFIDEN